MTVSNSIGHNETHILKGRVVSLEQINMDNAAVDRCRNNYNITYKYEPNTLPDYCEVETFCKAESKNEKEVAILQNAVRCLKALDRIPEDTSILDEYVNDTLLEFDFVTGKNIFDDKTFEKDSTEHKNKQLALMHEYNKIVASTTLLNAVENAKKLQQIKDKIVELQKTQPTKDDAKYNHPEIVKGTTSVKQALDRYKELHDLRNKGLQEWKQYELDYKHRNAPKLSISEDIFKVFKVLFDSDVLKSGTLNPWSKMYECVQRYKSVKDCNENSWERVLFDGCAEGKRFLDQKQLTFWKKYGRYNQQYYGPRVTDWMMYDHFNDKDLKWLTALKAFHERVTALKRIEEQHTDVCEQHTDVCEQHTDESK